MPSGVLKRYSQSLRLYQYSKNGKTLSAIGTVRIPAAVFACTILKYFSSRLTFSFFEVEEFADAASGIYQHEDDCIINICILDLPHTSDLCFCEWLAIVGIRIPCIFNIQILDHVPLFGDDLMNNRVFIHETEEDFQFPESRIIFAGFINDHLEMIEFHVNKAHSGDLAA